MDIKKLGALCLQGNVLGAIEYFKSFENKGEELLELEKKYEERFITQTEVEQINSEDPWVIGVVKAYNNYFRQVLTNKDLKESEEKLVEDLLQYIELSQGVDLDEVESSLEKKFNERGYSFLGGVTAPYRGPYIWKTTVKKEFDVNLLDDKQRVNVYFISDFLMNGWAHFATFGKNYAGGWAKPEGLYCVDIKDKKIDIESDEYQLSYLKHEGQHLSDFKRFPDLKVWELEYRAKLAELIYYPKTYTLIEKFLNEAKEDETFPHSYAAYQIIKQLSRKLLEREYVGEGVCWKQVEEDSIRKYGEQLLREHSKVVNC